MKRTTHAVIGAGFGGFFSYIFTGGDMSSLSLVVSWLFGQLGGVFPDNDVKYGKHRFTLHNVFVLGVTTVAILIGLKYLFGVWYLIPSIAWGFGFFSHLLIDSLTVYGVGWFYPLQRKTYGVRVTRFDSSEWNLILLVIGFFLMTYPVFVGFFS